MMGINRTSNIDGGILHFFFLKYSFTSSSLSNLLFLFTEHLEPALFVKCKSGVICLVPSQKVMATHRDLENLRHSSKSARSSLR